MDKEVMIEFGKGLASGVIKIALYVAAIIALSYAFVFTGIISEEHSVAVAAMSLVTAMFIYFGIDMAYSGAKRRVEYRRKWGEEL